MDRVKINVDGLVKVDLKKEYQKAKKDPIFDKLVSKLRLSDEELFEEGRCSLGFLRRVGDNHYRC